MIFFSASTFNDEQKNVSIRWRTNLSSGRFSKIDGVATFRARGRRFQNISGSSFFLTSIVLKIISVGFGAPLAKPIQSLAKATTGQNGDDN